MYKLIFSLMVLLFTAGTSTAADIPQVPGDTSQMIMVDVARWLEDGSLGASVMKMPKWEFEQYVVELGSCKTREEAMAVLQKFNIVPMDVIGGQIDSAVQSQIIGALLQDKVLGNLPDTTEESLGWTHCQGGFCGVLGYIRAPFWMYISIPSILYLWKSDRGGWAQMDCEIGGNQNCSGDTTTTHWGLIIGWFGYPSFEPPYSWGFHWGYHILPTLYVGSAGFIFTSFYDSSDELLAYRDTERNVFEAPNKEENSRIPVEAHWCHQTNKYGGFNSAFSVQQTSDGGYYVVASAHDTLQQKNYAWLIKTDEDGETIWDTTYGGEVNDNIFDGGQTSDGGYILVSSRYTDSTTNKDDVWLLKTSSNGGKQWEKRFNRVTNDKGTSVIQTSDGGYMISGFCMSGTTACCLLMKTDINGNAVWESCYTEGSSFMGKSVRQTTDGGYIILGNTFSWPDSNIDIVLLKINSSGAVEHRRVYRAPGLDFGSSVRQTSDGGYIVIGGTDSQGHGGTDVWLLKTNGTLDSLWGRTFGGTGYDFGLSVEQTDDDCDGNKDDGFILTGLKTAPGSNDPHLWVIKTFRDGSLDWDMTPCAKAGSSGGQSVWQTSDRGYVVAGFTGSDVWLIKLGRRAGRYVVSPDSTSAAADFPTIQAAIDCAIPGDTIELSDGRFRGPGNWDIDFQGTDSLVIRSQHGANACTLDCKLTPLVDTMETPHRGFYFHSGENSTSVIEGITIIRGWPNGRGGGILCDSSSPTIRDCRIAGNSASFGGGISCYNSAAPTIIRCTITGNKANSNGGGIYCSNNSSPTIVSCTISGNKAYRGGGIYQLDSSPHLTRSIVWGNCAGSGDGDEWYCGGNIPIYCCSDVDASGFEESCIFTIICPESSSISKDPRFCNPVSCDSAPTTAGDYYLRANSPCLPDSQSVCGLIGAFGLRLAGDCNADRAINSADVSYIINYLFIGGPPPTPFASGDVNCDETINAADVVYLINYLFIKGPVPCSYCL